MPLSGDEDHRQSAADAKPAATEQDNTIERMRKVVQTHQTARIGGMAVDELTAQMVVRAHDRLTGKKREKFANLSPKQMVCKAFEMADKGR